ncbi:biopolymer transport protein ExbB/TolQ [Bradyrhizobium japonicum]
MSAAALSRLRRSDGPSCDQAGKAAAAASAARMASSIEAAATVVATSPEIGL